MANWKQWQRKFPERKRLMWISSSSSMQVKDILDKELSSRLIEDCDFCRLDGSDIEAVDVLDALQQYPHSYNRLVVLISGNKIKWNERLLQFIWSNYKNFQFLVTSVEKKVNTKESHLRPFVEKGRFVGCGKIKEPISFIKSLCSIDEQAAFLLVNRVGTEYSDLKWAVEKLSSFNRLITVDIVNRVIDSGSTNDFVEQLLDGRKPMETSVDLPIALGLLRYKLVQFSLYLIVKWQKLNNFQLAKYLGIPVYYIGNFRKEVRMLDEKKLKRWIFLVYKIEKLRMKGIQNGLREYLVAKW